MDKDGQEFPMNDDSREFMITDRGREFPMDNGDREFLTAFLHEQSRQNSSRYPNEFSMGFSRRPNTKE